VQERGVVREVVLYSLSIRKQFGELFFGKLVEGHRKQGRPRKRYKDNLKDNLNTNGAK
jgi:hypothetical protein